MVTIPMRAEAVAKLPWCGVPGGVAVSPIALVLRRSEGEPLGTLAPNIKFDAGLRIRNHLALGREGPMLFFFGFVAALGSIAAMVYGVFIVYQGLFPGEVTEIEIEGRRAKLPVGIGVFLAGLVGLVVIVWIYSKGVESENAQLKENATKTDAALAAATADRDVKVGLLNKAVTDLQVAQKTVSDLTTLLAAADAARKEAQAFASETFTLR